MSLKRETGGAVYTPEGGKKKEKYSVKSEEYEVEDIVAHKKERGLDYFKVRWKGFDESDDTWEVESNLAHAPMFHSKMQELKKETEQRTTDRETETAAASHTKKRRRHGQGESDPSRPCGAEASTENDECEYRIYATGTKVPKNHLPDELALGNRLSILRFKRSSVQSSSSSSAADQEEGHDITVTYTIDGTDTYTIPFSAARRYCCQRLLSYLIRRTTFRTPKTSQETTVAGDAAGKASSTSSSINNVMPTSAATDEHSVEECTAGPSEMHQKAEVYGQPSDSQNEKEGGKSSAAGAAAVAAAAGSKDVAHANSSNSSSSNSSSSKDVKEQGRADAAAAVRSRSSSSPPPAVDVEEA